MILKDVKPKKLVCIFFKIHYQTTIHIELVIEVKSKVKKL